MGMSPLDALHLFNCTPSEYGLRVRDGYVEWANDASPGLKAIRSLLGFVGQTGTVRLFAVTSDGVYDISSTTTNPTLVVDYSAIGGWVTTGDAGYCSQAQFTTTATSYLLVADEVNGYFYYDGTTWTTAPTLSGSIADSRSVNYVFVWKNRVWLSEQDTASAHYLATGAISGAASEFAFGNKFSYGGHLKGLYSFTRDGGAGIDDFLVAIGAGGDLLVYQGYDPAAVATFELKGSWYIGDMPAGKRVAVSFGGDLVVLSVYGLLSVSKLLSGKSIAEPDFYLTYKIAKHIRDLMATDRTTRGWDVFVDSVHGLLIINTPKLGVSDYIQFAADLNTGAWGIWRGVPMFSSIIYQGRLYFGTSGTGANAKVYYMDGHVDNLLLVGGDSGQVAFSGQTAFQVLGVPSQSQIVFINPYFIAEFSPSFVVEAMYDFNQAEISAGTGSPPVSGGDVWDTGMWDTAIWEVTEELSPFSAVRGATGMGRYVSVAFKGATASATVLLGFDVVGRQGGYL
jgi:hypothetical protein